MDQTLTYQCSMRGHVSHCTCPNSYHHSSLYLTFSAFNSRSFVIWFITDFRFYGGGLLAPTPNPKAGCETWSLTFREEHRLRVFENRALRRIFGPKRDEVMGEWRKLPSG
jgi:hypothetical protein